MNARDQPADGPRRAPRPPRVGDGRAPMTTLVVLAGATAAVVAGIVILRSIGEPAGGPEAAAVETAPPATSAPIEVVLPTAAATTTTAAVTTTTVAARPSDAALIVANASGVDGSATAMAADLGASGYTVAQIANAPGQRIEQSIIYYVEASTAAAGVARLLATQIPTAQVLPMPAQPPLDRPLGAATVALLLGRDAAGRPLATLTTG